MMIKELKLKHEKFERDVKYYQERISKLQNENLQKEHKITELMHENAESRRKIIALERSILDGESNLKSANSNLEKLRLAIKDNRAADLKK